MAIKREQVIRTAEKYVAKGKLEAAIKEYRKVLAENPNDANTLNRVGDLYARTERFDEAVKLFSQIADQYTRDGFHVKAIAIYKKIIKLDPTSLQVYERLAELYHKQGLLNEARGQYQVLADYYEKHDNAASAISIYQRMSEIEPENPTFHLKLAELYKAQQLIDKALREYRRLADLLLVNGSVDEATQVYLKALDISSEDLDFIREAVSGLHDGGHVGAAAQVLTKATELNPEAEQIARQVGMGGPEAGAPEVAEPEAARSPSAIQEPKAETDEVSFDIGDDLEVPEVAATEAAGTKVQAGEEKLAEAFVAELERAEPPSDVSVFTLDLDDDEMPSTQVVPPPDMLEDAAAEDVEFDLSIDDFEAQAVPDPDFESVAAAADEAVAAGGPMVGDELSGEVEIDWMGDLEGIDFAQESGDPVPAGKTAATEEEVEFSGFEIDLEETAAGEHEPVPAEAQAPEPLAEPPPIGPKALRHEDDLLAEAKVFAKYGLHEKARDRLHELLDIRPQHLEGLQLLAKIDLEAGRREQAMARANEISRLAIETGNLGPWHELRDDLVKAGFALEDDLVTSEPAEKAGEDDRIAQLLDDLSIDSLDEVPRGADTGKFQVLPPAAAEPPLPVTQPPAPRTPTAQEPAPTVEAAPASTAKQLISLADELGLDDLDEMEEVAIPAAQEAAPPPAAPAVEDLDETGMSWLDEPADDMAVTRHNEAIFDEEADFFDLASELERELKDEEPAKPEIDAEGQPQEQSLQEIIDGFKQGVAENLSSGDCDTHFNLGIAYREMGLLDEAIGEFQLAAKDPRFMVECSSMLGICFLEKGLPELAIKWYRKGLETPSINEDQTLGLLYDMGAAYINVGDAEKAYKTFVEIYGINSNYRDVAAKLYELSQAP